MLRPPTRLKLAFLLRTCSGPVRLGFLSARSAFTVARRQVARTSCGPPSLTGHRKGARRQACFPRSRPPRGGMNLIRGRGFIVAHRFFLDFRIILLKCCVQYGLLPCLMSPTKNDRSPAERSGRLPIARSQGLLRLPEVQDQLRIGLRTLRHASGRR
jgi:hypothetical protein